MEQGPQVKTDFEVRTIAVLAGTTAGSVRNYLRGKSNMRPALWARIDSILRELGYLK